MEAERDGFVLRDDAGPSGVVRLVSEEEARELFPAIHERVRRARPGMISRTPTWWELQRLPDPEHFRRGAGPKFYVVLELDDEPAGYAMYRVKTEWERGLPEGEVRVQEALATTPAGERELWRFLFAIDLTGKVTAFPFDPVSPLFLMVVDPRRLRLTLVDGLWLRLVEVEEALRRRTYESDEPVVLDVRDALCPWNEGTFRIGPSVERTTDAADLRLSVADLGSAYLGAFSFSELARAGRVEELQPGGLERADSLFQAPVTPWCAEVF
jgi:predicted acetyltransferase